MNVPREQQKYAVSSKAGLIDGITCLKTFRLFMDTQYECIAELLQQMNKLSVHLLHRLLRSHQQPVSHPEQPDSSLTLSQRGAYVITGGLGSLGVLVAAWLSQKQQAGST